jgi:hypothetical protein
MHQAEHGPGTRRQWNAIRAMLLIRLAISIFALTLLGLAFSLNAAQSEQNDRIADTATLTHR